MARPFAFKFLVTTDDPGRDRSMFRSDINAHISRYTVAQRKPILAGSSHAGGKSAKHTDFQRRHDSLCRTTDLSDRGPLVSYEVTDDGKSRRPQRTHRSEALLDTMIPGEISLSTTLGLDPFLSLPLKVSLRDQRLLQFYLTQGRILQRGTTSEPRYCPALEICRALLEKSKTLVLVSIVIAEFVFCAVVKKEPSSYLHRRHSQARRILNKELSDPCASAHDKAYAVIHMIFLEGIIGTLDWCARYLHYLDDLVASNGGIVAFLASGAIRSQYSIQQRYISSMYLVAEVPIKQDQEFLLIRQGFLASLQVISNWSTNLCSKDLDFDSNRRMLWPLGLYLSRLIDAHLLPKDVSFTRASGAFYCCYSICLTLAKHNWSTDQCLEYLSKVQRYIVGETKPGDGVNGTLHPLQMLANTHNLAAIREDMNNLSQSNPEACLRWAEERDISQRLVNGQKTFALMPKYLRSKIIRILCQSAMSLTGEVPGSDVLDAPFLDLIDREITQAWYRSQQQLVSVQLENSILD